MPFARYVTLTAGTVQSWTFTGSAANASAFEIINRNGLDEVFISHDGTATPPDPTVGGNDFDFIPAATGAGIQMARSRSTQNAVTVKVISASATKVSIRSIQ